MAFLAAAGARRRQRFSETRTQHNCIVVRLKGEKRARYVVLLRGKHTKRRRELAEAIFA
jgi:hypothetical protein